MIDWTAAKSKAATIDGKLNRGGYTRPVTSEANPTTAQGAGTLPLTREARGDVAGAWLPDSVRAQMDVKTPAVSVAKPVETLPTAPMGKFIPMPTYEREQAALSAGVSLPMARMQQAASTPASLKRQSNWVESELEAAQKERAALTPRTGPISVESDPGYIPAAYQDTMPTFERDPAMAAVDKRIADLNTKRAGLGARFYEADNREKLGKIGADEKLGASYEDAKSRQSDLDRLNRFMSMSITDEASGTLFAAEQKYFKDKFGVIHADPTAYSDLLIRLSEDVGDARAALYDSGISFPRVSRYEEKQAEAQERAKALEETERQAREHPVSSSVASVIAAPAKGLDILGNAIGYMGKSDLSKLDSYEPMYATDFPVSNYVNTVRGTVAKKIEENTDLEIFGQNVASFLYQTGMSVADSATQVAALGPYATVLMGMGAASDTARDVVARGGSNNQAFMSGLAAGAAEAIFEKFSIDNLLTKRSVDSVKRLIMETAKQTGVEATEEIATEIANILSDAAIMGQNSNFNNAVRGYMAQGMSEDEAKQKAYLDNVAQIGWAGAGGALSGGLMGGFVNGMNYAGNAQINAAERRIDTSIDKAYGAMMEHGLFSEKAGEAVRSANRANGLPAAGIPYVLPGVYEQQKTASTGEAAEQIVSDDNMTRYRSAVDGVFTGALPTGSDIVLGDTPSILQQYGVPALNIHMTQSVARKIAYPENYFGGKHNLGLSALKNLPYQIADPLAIVENPQPNSKGLKSKVIITEWFDEKGKQIIVPIHLSAQGAVELQNDIASAFGADYIQTILGDNDQNVLYTKNNEDIHQLLSKRRPMPQAMADDVLADFTVPQGDSGVKGQDAPMGGGVFLPGSGLEQLDTFPRGFYNEEKEMMGHGREEAGAAELRGIYGADVRGEAQGADAGGAGTDSQADGAGTAHPAADWARGDIVGEPLNRASARAGEQAREYVPDVYMVKDAVLKGRSPGAWGLTSDGVIYLSDSIPDALADVVGHHEVVHAVKQRGNPQYQAFVSVVPDKVNFRSKTAGDVLDIVLRSRFGGKSMFDLTPAEAKTAYDELNAVIWGYHKANPENARAQFAGMFVDYDGYISELDAIMEGGKGGGSVGAAEGGFDPYTRLQNQYGTIVPGENPARIVDVPKQTSESDRVSATARTVMEAAATPGAFVPEVAQAVVDGKLSYIPITNKDTAGKARSVIERDGFQRAYGDWRASVAKGKTSADLTAMGITLYNAAVNAGDTKLALDIVGDYAKNVRDAAQATQAARILKTLTPEGKLYLAQKTVLALQEDLNHRFGDGKYNLTIREELADTFLHADGDTAREAAMENIYRDVAAQVPSTWADKWNAWRYFSMLGNPRTHIRNIAGNAGFVPVRVAKDMLATGIEAAANKVLPGGIERTKAALNPLNESDRALLESAWADGGAHMDEILGEGKFRDKPQGKIEEYRTIFKTLPLEAGRQFNTKALDVEDTWFSRPAYATALAGWLKANHTTLDTAAVETLDRARAYAIREAQRATYRDSNAFSDFVSGLRYRGDKKVGQAANVLMEGVLPFRKTPANILVRGVEYSPVGLVKGLTADLAQVKNGKMSAAQAIDNISAGLTGTGIMALGALLASMVLVTGGSGDDEKDEHGRTMGKQPYALTIGDKNYTLDWLAPEALPFFVGVELYNAKDAEGTGRTLDDLYSAMGSITEPMLEMSMLQSLQDTIDSVSYSDNKLMGILSSAATGYVTQAFPTVLGQMERTAEGERQSTYIDRTSQLPNDLQYTLGRVMNKLPGEFQQMPYIDAWGRKQSTGTLPTRAANNFLNPSYVSEEKITGADKEIQRLLETGQTGVAPNRLSQSTKIGDSYLTKEQYQSYAIKKGETSLDVVSELIERKGYSGFSDEEKAEAVRNAYSYADAVGKLATGADYEPSGWVAKAIEAEKQGVSPADYILYRQALPDGSVSQYEAGSALVGENMGNREKGALWALQNDSWPSDKNPFTGALSKTGVKPETAVQIAGKYGEIDKKYEGYVKPEGGASKATAQTTEFYRWLDGLGLTDEQYDTATGLYRFSTYIPGKPEGYRLDLMSEAAQKKWPTAEKAGFSEEEYSRYYPVFSSGTKHDAIEKAVGMGMTRAQANRFWGIVR